ncbi:hypothetical protein Tco_0109284 [Tanacetum coccineum]
MKATKLFTSQKIHLQQFILITLEEIDIRWRWLLLPLRARGILEGTLAGRKFYVNGTETIGFDKSKLKLRLVKQAKAVRKNNGALIIEDWVLMIMRDA